MKTKVNTHLVTVIIPTFNEAKFIESCLDSLKSQTYQSIEIIIVDDGSSDKTVEVLKKLVNSKKYNLQYLIQAHSGPGVARNLASKLSKGEILVFIDADMTFDNNFIYEVTKPIRDGVARGTDSQAGILGNPENYWARCWNLGKFAAAGNFTNDYLLDITPNKKNYGGIFRSILKSEFIKVGGFETDGDYTDDASLGKKLGYKAKIVKKGQFYHWNPDTMSEVWMRASWIGSGKNYTKSKRKIIFNLLKFFPLVSVVKGLILGYRFGYISFVFFKVVYDSAVWWTLIKKIL